MITMNEERYKQLMWAEDKIEITIETIDEMLTMEKYKPLTMELTYLRALLKGRDNDEYGYSNRPASK